MGCILDYFQPVLIGNRLQFVHVARESAVVNADDRFGLVGYPATYIRGINIQRPGLHVGDYNLCSHVKKRDACGGASEERRNYLVTWLQAGQNVSQMKGIRSRPDCNGWSPSAKLGTELFLKGFHHRPLTNPTTSQYGGYFLGGVGRYVGMKENDIFTRWLHNRKFIHWFL